MFSKYWRDFWDIQKLFFFLPQKGYFYINEDLLSKFRLRKGMANAIALIGILPFIYFYVSVDKIQFMREYRGVWLWIFIIAVFQFIKSTLAFVVIMVINKLR